MGKAYWKDNDGVMHPIAFYEKGADKVDTMPLTTDVSVVEKADVSDYPLGTYNVVGTVVYPYNLNVLLQKYNIELSNDLVKTLMDYDINIVTASTVTNFLKNWFNSNIVLDIPVGEFQGLPLYILANPTTVNPIEDATHGFINISVVLSKVGETDKLLNYCVWSNDGFVKRVEYELELGEEESMTLYLYSVDYDKLNNIGEDRQGNVDTPPINTIGDHDTFIGLVNDGWTPTMEIRISY